MAGMNKQTVSFAVLLFTASNCCFAANILILGYPSYSHLVGPANVGKFLQDQGHNVLIAIPPQLKEKLQSHGVKLLLYHGLGDFSENHLLGFAILNDYFETKLSSDSPSLLSPSQILTNVAQKILKDVKLRKDIENFKPDLMMMDFMPIGVMITLIPYKLNIPFVMIGSREFAQYTRSPILPTVFPHEDLPYTDQMTFPQRMYNTFTNLLAYRRSPYINSSVVNEYVLDKPDISLIDLQAKAQLWIIRQNGVLGYNPPTMPNVKRVGHLQNLAPKPLPPEFESFIESAEHGIVVVSFGSVLGYVPTQVKEKLLAAFEQTKYNFIIQSPLQQKNQSDKIMSRKWLPQFDLLRHQKTKLFITHCGANGLQETLIAGVPIIGFPLFNDQPKNAGKVVRKRFGLKLELRSFSVQELVSAIEEVITNPSYRANVEKASAILKSERVPPVEEAAFWINHVLTFGGDHLRSYAQDIPLWKYLGLDIIAFCLLVWHVFLYLVIILLKFCFSRCCGRKQKLKDE